MIKKICAISGLICINQFSFSYSSEFREALSNPDLWNQKKASFIKEIGSSESNFIENLTIKGIDFSNMPLKNLTFVNCKFVDVKFVNTDLKNVTLIAVEFDNVDLDGAILAEGLKFNKEMSPIDLVKQYSDFITQGQQDKAKGLNNILGVLKLQLQGKDLKKANLLGIDFSGANLENADLTEAHLEGAIFMKSNLKNCKFNRANLTNATFNHARVEDTHFNEANLTKSHFILEDYSEFKKFNLTEDQIKTLGPLFYEYKDTGLDLKD